MSLRIGETEGEMNEVRLLNTKLDRTQKLVDSLVEQLTELKEEVCSFNYKYASFSLLKYVSLKYFLGNYLLFT